MPTHPMVSTVLQLAGDEEPADRASTNAHILDRVAAQVAALTHRDEED